MTTADRWLLPDGIEEVLPDRALPEERVRRQLLDLFHRWGYDLVIPPLAEFTESLLSGSGRDLDLMTFKITDQLSGRLMGIRADITPQAARIDAHSLRLQGPCRLCYAGTVLQTRLHAPLESRSPTQVGVELFGEKSIAADIEVLSLLQAALLELGVADYTIELGHVEVCRVLISQAQLNEDQQSELSSILERKAVTELDAWVTQHVEDTQLAAMLRQLPSLSGGIEVVDRALDKFEFAPIAVVEALQQLKQVATALQRANSHLSIHIDLSEIHGYHYHTGIVFAAYLPTIGKAIANGGRYDDVGLAFGRARPATGFGLDLRALIAVAVEDRIADGIFAPFSTDAKLTTTIAALRAKGERVVAGFEGQDVDYHELNCDRVLVQQGAEYIVQPI